MNVSVAVTAPAVVGLNVTVNGTLCPAGMVTGSDSPPTLNTELFEVAAVTVTLAPLSASQSVQERRLSASSKRGGLPAATFEIDKSWLNVART